MFLIERYPWHIVYFGKCSIIIDVSRKIILVRMSQYKSVYQLMTHKLLLLKFFLMLLSIYNTLNQWFYKVLFLYLILKKLIFSKESQNCIFCNLNINVKETKVFVYSISYALFFKILILPYANNIYK